MTSINPHFLLEYCNTGILWDVVQPLICQKNRNLKVKSAIDDVSELEARSKSPVQKQTSIIRPSESFIHERKVSINMTKSDRQPICDENSDDDLMIVHKTNVNSVVVVNSNNIEHFDDVIENSDGDEAGLRLKCDSNLLQNSQSMIDNISEKIDRNEIVVRSVIDNLEDIESKLKLHLEGDVKKTKETIPGQPSSSDVQKPVPARPKVLRKLSEILPQCSSFLDDASADMTELPDKLIRY